MRYPVAVARWLGLLVVMGCYDPSIATGIPCARNDECPRGQLCAGNVCGGTADAADPPTETIVIGEDAAEVRDVEIWGAEPNTNHNDSDHFSIDDAESGLLWFDVTSIPSTRTVVAATLTVMIADEADEDGGTATVHRVRREWVESEATWLLRTSTQDWPASGARPPASDETPVATFSPAATETAYDIELPASLVQAWIASPAENFGLVFVRGSSNQHVHVRTRESGVWSRLTLDVR
jgi:hypothetical protein